MLNIAICDDDKTITGKLDMLLQNIAKEKVINTDTEVFWDGEHVVDSIKYGTRYDIIFLDIEMNKLDGITTAMEIRKYDKNVLIIYVTNHDSYMKSSFDVRPFRFLTKPIDILELKRCFMAAYEELMSSDFYFRYRYERISHKISIKDILYFESQKRKVFIITNNGSQCMYGKLSDIEKELLKCKVTFLRVHQSYLVNYLQIEKQSYDHVVMKNNQRIPISEDRRRTISKQYCMSEDIFSV